MKPYTMSRMPRISKKEQKRMEFARSHPPVRCAACKAGGTLRKLDGKYLCTGCYDAVVSERLRLNL